MIWGTCARYLRNRGRILGILSDVDLVVGKSVTERQVSADTACFLLVYKISVPHIIRHSIPLTRITGPQ